MVLIGGASGIGSAAPKVCGSDPALGSFDTGSCPELKDDGVAPDEVKNDGIYTAQVSLSPQSLLEYKILPTGAFDGSQLGQSGTCDVQGGSTNPFGNIQVPGPDVSRPVRFFYDSRVLSDPSYAAPPGNRSAGDDLMLRSPAARCPQWLAVGDFQGVPFDRTVGTVQLTLVRPGVLSGRLTAMKALAIGWHWKVAEAGGAGTAARLYGPGGWADAPCDTDSVSVASAVKPGDVVYFTWYGYLGRLQTVVLAAGTDPADGGVIGGLPLCPPPADPGDLGTPTDLGGSAPPDASTGGTPADGGAGDGGGRPLPGIHCNCQLGGATGGPPLGAGVSFVSVAVYLLVGARRRRPKNSCRSTTPADPQSGATQGLAQGATRCSAQGST